MAHIIQHAKSNNFRAIIGEESIFIIDDVQKRMIKIGLRHNIYAFDIINSFDTYFSSVEPNNFAGHSLVDFSYPHFYHVKGFTEHQIMFPAFSEPIETSYQYVNFGRLEPGGIALDLGAYAGMTSILFKKEVGNTGSVIAVEADKKNFFCTKINLLLHKEETGNQIDLLFGAVWKDNDGIMFSSEENMGSSATSIVGDRCLSAVEKVPSYTLDTIARKYNLEKVDFIKCDIEGGEYYIFEDAAFFARFRPRIIVEPHDMPNIGMATSKVIEDLERFGYVCTCVPQIGATLPLIECVPPLNW